MKFKKYNHALEWTDITSWKWPAGDKKLVQVFDHVADIDVIVQHVDQMRSCIQAGGACGVWPLRYAQLFKSVHTFEPQPENYACLMENCKGVPNISAYHAPIGDDRKKYVIHNDIQERENWGAGYVIEDANGIEAMAIDDLGVDDCDLIQLDVEGFELRALRGAYKTIEKCRPSIVLEEKPLNHVRGDGTDARRWLELTFGYRLVAKVHRDVILRC